MKVPLYVFLILGTGSIVAYFGVCAFGTVVPALPHALKIGMSSASVGGATKVIAFAFSRLRGRKQRLIEEDLSLGVAMLAGAFVLIWFGIENILRVLWEVA